MGSRNCPTAFIYAANRGKRCKSPGPRCIPALGRLHHHRQGYYLPQDIIDVSYDSWGHIFAGHDTRPSSRTFFSSGNFCWNLLFFSPLLEIVENRGNWSNPLLFLQWNLLKDWLLIFRKERKINNIFHDSRTLQIGIEDGCSVFRSNEPRIVFLFSTMSPRREREREGNKRCTLAQLYRNPCKFIPLLSKDFVLPWSSIFLHPSPLRHTPYHAASPWKKIDLACRASSFSLSLSLSFSLQTKQTTTRSFVQIFTIFSSRRCFNFYQPIIDRSRHPSIPWNNR